MLWLISVSVGSVIAPGGCSTLPVRAIPELPGWTESRVGPFLIESTNASPSESAEHSLRVLESRLRDGLALEANPELRPIRVIVFDDEEQLARLMTHAHPDLPTRRAFFLAEGGKLTIYAHRGERLHEDLQHEATHALLHATVGVLPLWLDEGLAEYFEVDPGNTEEVQRRSRSLIRSGKEGWSPDLARLERLRVITELDSSDYREAWGWVHLMMEGPEPARQILRRRLQSASDGGEGARSIHAEIEARLGSPEAVFWKHMEQVALRQSTKVVRAQDTVPSRPQPRTQIPPTPLPFDTTPLNIEPPRSRSLIGRLINRIFNE